MFFVECRGSIPDRNTILWSIEAFPVMKTPPAFTWAVRAPDNVRRVKRTVLASPQRSTRCQVSALGMPHRSLRRVLHDDLKFHSYKVMIVQQLTEKNFAQCREVDAIIFLMTLMACLHATYLWCYFMSRVYAKKLYAIWKVRVAIRQEIAKVWRHLTAIIFHH